MDVAHNGPHAMANSFIKKSNHNNSLAWPEECRAPQEMTLAKHLFLCHKPQMTSS
jgi:hypothetical protein